MAIHILKTEEEVLTQLANYFVASAGQAIKNHGRFSVALSGGNSPKKLYELLASPAFKNEVDWHKVYFFFGDERYVPHTDPESNYLMVLKALFEPLHIHHSHIFAVDTKPDPEEAARKYEQTIHDFFNNDEWRFDLILLGLGDNSHTASLFPFTPVLHDTKPSVSAVYLKDKGVYRITLNAPLINEARRIAFLVYGEGKAIALHHVLEEAYNIELFPAQLISPKDGELHWFIDEHAASELTKR